MKVARECRRHRVIFEIVPDRYDLQRCPVCVHVAKVKVALEKSRHDRVKSNKTKLFDAVP